MPKLDPIPPAEWPDTLAHMTPGYAGKANVYRVMAHHPALLAAWDSLRDHIVMQSALGPERLEVVILRAGYRLGSDYEWQHHILRARAAGLTDARIAAMRGPLQAMDPDDALLARAVDELFEAKRLSPETATSLRTSVGKEGALDLIATVGFYSTLGYLLNTYDVPLDEGIRAALDAAPLEP